MFAALVVSAAVMLGCGVLLARHVLYQVHLAIHDFDAAIWQELGFGRSMKSNRLVYWFTLVGYRQFMAMSERLPRLKRHLRLATALILIPILGACIHFGIRIGSAVNG